MTTTGNPETRLPSGVQERHIAKYGARRLEECKCRIKHYRTSCGYFPWRLFNASERQRLEKNDEKVDDADVQQGWTCGDDRISAHYYQCSGTTRTRPPTRRSETDVGLGADEQKVFRPSDATGALHILHAPYQSHVKQQR